MSETVHAPTLVFIVGPPAVGKMAVGHELAQRTGFKLFHNHHTIDLAIRFFPFGSPPFQRLVGEFRRRIFETDFRLAEKPFKRDLEQSRRQLLDLDEKYQLNSHGKYDGRPDYLRIDNSAIPASVVADTIIDSFGLLGANRPGHD